MGALALMPTFGVEGWVGLFDPSPKDLLLPDCPWPVDKHVAFGLKDGPWAWHVVGLFDEDVGEGCPLEFQGAKPLEEILDL